VKWTGERRGRGRERREREREREEGKNMCGLQGPFHMIHNGRMV
jgi:hypothetical protein